VILRMCAMAEHTAASALWMPVRCGSEETMRMARALECATLGYRRPRGRVAYVSHYFHDSNNDDDCKKMMTYRAFRRALQRHAASRNVLELDMLREDAALPTNDPRILSSSSWLSFLQPGTSVERDERQKARLPLPNTPATPAGDWLNGTQWWTCWTPAVSSQGSADRDRHYHYALATSLRLSATAISSDEVVSKYVTSIMESMGIRYRPEQALCAVVHPTVAPPHFPWMAHNGATSSSSVSGGTPPTLSVLGNTTRIHPYLHARAAVSLPSFLRGMERDDVLEAQVAGLDLRDSYAPPRGSGLLRDDDDDAAGEDFG
jgi:hypothetical protein